MREMGCGCEEDAETERANATKCEGEYGWKDHNFDVCNDNTVVLSRFDSFFP